MDLARYADLFLTESREHLSAINHALLELEHSGDSTESVSVLFRGVHTIKGMSATMGYAAVAELANGVETLLDRIRSGELPVSPPVIDALFSAADALESAIELSVAGRAESADVTSLVEQLRELAPSTATFAVMPRPEVWTAADPGGEGTLVRVRLEEETLLRGARALLIIQRAHSLGDVTGISPTIESIKQAEFGHDFALRVKTNAEPEAIERLIRDAGDVERVEIVAAQTSAAPRSGSAPTPRRQRHVRIELRRLDTLMNLIGELIIARGRLTQIASATGDDTLVDAVAATGRLIGELQDEIMTSRMVPVGQVLDRFPRLVRDAARASGKQVELTVEGKETELDRSLLDEIGDPIVHLLRNAIDHGVELPAERRRAGKPEVGQLTLSAARDRSVVLVRVSDDGRGIDRAKVLVRARALGLVEGARGEPGDEEILRLIAHPGFSTAERVSDLSGRGVGIDAVQDKVRALGGSLELRSVSGLGTTITMRLPLTLAIVRAVLARVDAEMYAVPITHVVETVELDATSLSTVKGHEVLMLRDEVLPVVRFRDVVGLPAHQDAAAQVIIVQVADRRAGIVVDELESQQDIVVKQFDAPRGTSAAFSGATILGDGAPALIVDVSSLI